MTTKISNTEKILLVLKEIDDTVGTKDLALFTNINVKNIGRYLEKMTANKLVSRKTIQDGKKRYTMNKILAKGKNFKFTTTYDEFKNELNTPKLTDVETELITNGITLNKDNFDSAVRETHQEIKQINNINGKETYRAELLSLIKILAIRDVDAQSIGLKDKQELTNLIISLILKL